MLCQSHKGTLNVIDGTVKDYDSLPKTWHDDLIERIQPDPAQVLLPSHIINALQLHLLFWIEFR